MRSEWCDGQEGPRDVSRPVFVWLLPSCPATVFTLTMTIELQRQPLSYGMLRK